MTTKLLNLEAIKSNLCSIHIVDNCGIYEERYLKSVERSKKILLSTVAKIIYDLMGQIKSDSLELQLKKRHHRNILECPDTYKQQVDSLLEVYAKKPSNKKLQTIDLFVIDEYAMINPETLYFLIKFFEITSTATTVVFILSGDPDQMEPINHDLRDLNVDAKDEHG